MFIAIISFQTWAIGERGFHPLLTAICYSEITTMYITLQYLLPCQVWKTIAIWHPSVLPLDYKSICSALEHRFQRFKVMSLSIVTRTA